ncbi:MAG TPA: tetratricopeptide repeat protein [Geobacteraceae bacterium]
MAHADTADYFDKGIEALRHNHLFLARVCFEQAVGVGQDPTSCSYLAWCQAKTRGEYAEAVALAEAALDREPANHVHYLNLGRIHLLAGDKMRAIEVFRQGMPFDAGGAIARELEKFGSRKPPVVRSLARSHPLNRFLGMLLTRLGLR